MNVKEKKVLTNDKLDNNININKEINVERRKRVPLYDQRRMIGVDKDPDFEYRFFNDVGNRLNEARLAGWELVNRETGKNLEINGRLQDPSWKHSALSQHVGDGRIAYCMRIPKAWYIEDQKAKQLAIDKNETQLLKAKKLGNEKNTITENVIGEIQLDRTIDHGAN